MLNYLTVSKPPQFADSASSALFVATSYRLAIMGYSTATVKAAEQTRAFVESQVDASGWLVGAVNPFSWRKQLPAGQHSPEGQVRRSSYARADCRRRSCS